MLLGEVGVNVISGSSCSKSKGKIYPRTGHEGP